jgi:tryptophan-rich sensory protein
MTSALIYSIAACAVSIALEALLAGRGIKARFAELRLPRYAPPLWLWVFIGLFYYVMCFAVIYRLLSLSDAGPLRPWALLPLGSIMLINALWNYLFFRTRNLFHAFVIGLPYTLIALPLFPLLLRLDRVAASCVLPYLFYLIYANVLGYRLWKLNPPAAPSKNPKRVSDA